MRTVVLVILYVVIVVLITPFILAAMLLGMRDPIIAVGQWAMRLGRRVLGIRVDVAGLGRIPPRTPVVFMSNHLSFLDGPLLGMLIPGAVRIIIKKSIFRIPVIGQAMRFVGFVPVDRKRAQRGKLSIARAAALMRDRGYSFLLFPEGTRSRDGRLQAFRRGGFFLALESGAPIVPVSIRGTFELMPKGRWRARRGAVWVEFHEPVPVAGYSPQTMAGLMDKVRGAILAPLEG